MGLSALARRGELVANRLEEVIDRHRKILSGDVLVRGEFLNSRAGKQKKLRKGCIGGR